MQEENKAIEPTYTKIELKRRNRSTPSKQQLTALLQSHSKRAIKELVWLMKHSKNESLRAECAKAILNKSIPDVKAIQAQDSEGNTPKYTVLMGNGFVYKPKDIESTTVDVVSEPIDTTKDNGDSTPIYISSLPKDESNSNVEATQAQEN